MTSQNTKTVNNILVVDDDPDILNFLIGLFDDHISVSFASDGAKAIEHVQANKPDLILLDVAMPVMDGFEVCSRLKSDSATKHIPVIFLTGVADEKSIADGLKLGAIDYITKPIDAQIVIAKVKNQLAHIKPLPRPNADRSDASRDRRAEGAARQDRHEQRAEVPARPEQRAEGPARSNRSEQRAAPARVAATSRAGNKVSQSTVVMAVVALLVLGGGAFVGLKFYSEKSPETYVDANWPFSSQCEQSPFASWWGTSTHSSMVDYVGNRHNGDWNPYIDKWVNQLNKMADIDSRSGSASTSDGTVLRGKSLKEHVAKLEKRIAVLRCLANEAQYVK